MSRWQAGSGSARAAAVPAGASATVVASPQGRTAAARGQGCAEPLCEESNLSLFGRTRSGLESPTRGTRAGDAGAPLGISSPKRYASAPTRRTEFSGAPGGRVRLYPLRIHGG